jgi:hypothetical protein
MMKYIKLPLLLLFFNLNAFGQFIKEKKETNSEERELKIAKANISQDYILSNKKLILSNKEIAIKVAEPILFSIYGETKIISEKPYNVSFKENMWIITGTVHSMKGGAFIIILDAKNSKVLRVIHEK